MSNVTYSAGNLTITVAGLDTVEQALGDLKRKTLMTIERSLVRMLMTCGSAAAAPVQFL